MNLSELSFADLYAMHSFLMDRSWMSDDTRKRMFQGEHDKELNKLLKEEMNHRIQSLTTETKL